MKFKTIAGMALAGFISLGASATASLAQTCVIVLPFDFNSAAVSQTNRDLLEVIRQRYNNTTVELEGHTDAVGSASYNRALSARRVQTVANYITTGTNIRVITTVAEGESELVEATAGPSQANRRVEVTVNGCNPGDFGEAAASMGELNGAAVAGALLGAVLIIGALGDSSTTTTTTPAAANGLGALSE
ncbi:OmpA family protein [Rhodobacteraceae bacterium CCMM004]|nr:OmpA family protein [Rhodobacteraceae bacterium CCMM004]